MNRWTGMAYLTRDPELVKNGGGATVCRLRVAVRRAGRGGADGYFDVTCFDDQAETCARYLKKGREVAIDGRLSFDEFQTNGGERATRVSIIAERVEFLTSPRRRDDDDERDERPRKRERDKRDERPERGKRDERSGRGSRGGRQRRREPDIDADDDDDEVPF